MNGDVILQLTVHQEDIIIINGFSLHHSLKIYKTQIDRIGKTAG